MYNFWQNLKRPFTVLAPMEDVTDTVFRRIVMQFGRPDVFYTEFTSCEGLCSVGHDAVAHRLRFCEEERPIVAQVWGTKPETYYKAAKMLAELRFDGIDINMGCPVAKIVKSGACAKLIENKPLAREVYLAAQEGAGGLPLSIKTRIGFRKIETEEWIPFLLDLNPAALVVHGRIAKHLSKVPANWEEIGKAVVLRDQMQKPTVIIGNGDAAGSVDVLDKRARYGVDGVMVGRGIFDNLFVFNRELPERHFKDLEPREKLDWLKRHVGLYLNTWGANRDYGIMKKFFKIYASNFRGASELRVKLLEAESFAELEATIEAWLEGAGAAGLSAES